MRKTAAQHGGVDKSTGNIKQPFLNAAESGKYGETTARRANLAETLDKMHKK